MAANGTAMASGVGGTCDRPIDACLRARCRVLTIIVRTGHVPHPGLRRTGPKAGQGWGCGSWCLRK